MAQQNFTPVRPKRRRALRWPAILGAPVILVLGGGYLLLTSNAFLKGVVLPRIGASLNSEISAGEIRLRPFSGAVVRELKVVPRGQPELFRVQEARLRYSLTRILRGRFEVDEIWLDGPRISITRAADGASNLDPIIAATGTPEPSAEPAGDPVKFRLAKLEVRNAVLSYAETTAAEESIRTELGIAHWQLTDLGNSAKASTDLEATLHVQATRSAGSDALNANLKGAFQIALNEALLPENVQGSLTFEVPSASGAFAEAARLAAELKLDLAPQSLKEGTLTFARAGAPLGQVTVNGPLDLAGPEGALHYTVTGIGPAVLGLVGGRFGLGFSETRIAADGDIQIERQAQRIQFTSNVRADRFSVTMGGPTTPPLDATLTQDLAVDLARQSATLNRLEVAVQQAGQPRLTAALNRPMTIAWSEAGGGFEESSLEMKLSDLALEDWRPLLGPEIRQGTLAGDLKVDVADGGKIVRFGLDSRLTGFTADYGSAKIDAFEAALAGTGGMTNLVIGLSRMQLSVPPTDRAENRLWLDGSVDARDSAAIGGHLSLEAKSLDLTPYLAWFETTNQPAQPPEGASPPPPDEEPAALEPMTLPVKDLVVEAVIDQLFAREVAVTNWATEVRLDGGRVTVDPFRLAVNGVPASGTAQVDLSVPGWDYDVSLDAREVPLAPLVNSFSPDSRGKVGGTLTATGHLKGRGFTGAELRQHLGGTFDIGTTNLALKLVDVKSPMMRAVVNVAVELPTLLKNPAGALAGMVGRFTGSITGEDPAWVGALAQPPIDVVAMKGTAGAGRIELESARVETPAFHAGTRGAIQLADSLMDSLVSFPIELSLSRSLAEKIGQLPAGTATNQAFVALPGFFSLGGTLNEPARQLNHTALAQMVAGSASRLAGDNSGLGQQISGALGVLGNLTGDKASTNQTRGATSAEKVIGGLLEGLGSTNSGATNRPSLGGLLGGFLPARPKDTNNVPVTGASTNTPPR
ncbi:MAG: AsmA family protein [Verrucomicrobiales bacterium]|nr:AsmA family protein [Verrucomicrobiales bacterium]